MLSFIIPAHNEEHWIAKCLSSIRAAMEQIAEPYELIVVDDASTDATPKIAQQLFHDWQRQTNDQGPTTNALISHVVRGSPDAAQASTAGLQSLRILPVDSHVVRGSDVVRGSPDPAQAFDRRSPSQFG